MLLHQLLEASALANPEQLAIAVDEDSGQRMTYGDMSMALRFRQWAMLREELVRRHGGHGRMGIVPFTPMQIPAVLHP